MAVSAAVEDRRLTAMALRRRGKCYREIAELTGVSLAQAHEDVQTAIREYASEPANEVRTMELSRLDAAMDAIWDSVLEGSLEAIDRLLKIMDRRARLLGLDKGINPMVFIREMAEREGMDPKEAVAVAEEIARGMHG